MLVMCSYVAVDSDRSTHHKHMDGWLFDGLQYNFLNVR